MGSRWLGPIVVLITLLADSLTKQWALTNVKSGVSTPLIPGLINLTLTTNTGGAFGLGKDNAMLMTGIAIVVSLGLAIYLCKRELSATPPGALERIGLALIIGGALGNICDRLLLGRVTDFLEFAFIDFPVFNVADICIDTGVGLILLEYLKARPATERQDDQGTATG